MTNSLMKYLRKISHIGVTPTLHIEQVSRIALVNISAFICVIINTLITLIFSSTFTTISNLWITLAFSLIYIVVLLLNHWHHYIFASLLLFITIEIGIFLVSLTVGESGNFHYFYIFPIFTTIMGIDISNKRRLFVLLSIPILLLGILFFTDFALLPTVILPAEFILWINRTVLAFIITGIILITWAYISIDERNKIYLQEEINKRKKNEQLRKQSEARLRTLTENTQDSIWSVDTQMRLISINAAFKNTCKKAFGLDFKEGDSILNKFPKEMQKMWLLCYERAFAGESFKIEWSYFNTYLQKQIEVETQISPIKNASNEVDGATFFSRDITERKEAEQMLRRKDQMLTAINHNIKEGIFRSSIEQGGIYVNQAYVTMFGYDSIQEVLETPPTTLYANEADRARFIATLLQEKNINNEEVLYKRKDGSTFWALVSAILTEDENGDKFFDGTVKDITELKNIQLQLQKAKEIAEKSALSKSQFLSSMSHEIRTPLNAIIGLTRLLAEENPKPDQLENINTLQFSARNLLVLINDILDFNKIEAGKVVFEQIDFDMVENLKNIVNGFQATSEGNLNVLKLHIDDQIPAFIKGDPTRLSQILINLIGNAVKFTQKGSITINAMLKTQTERTITISFSVTDTGIGIPKEKQSAIFEGFTQATVETTRKYGGTGLGLAITKRLLEMQNSQINLESEVGKGSTFSFELTFKQSDKKQSGNIQQFAQHIFEPFTDQHVLVAEDNLANQLVAKRFLTKWGLNVSIAEDGEVALKLLENESFSLILMDIQMPKVDGYEATIAIRQIEKYKNLPIIALTASVTSGIREKVLAAGMNDYVLKPFEPEELYNKIAIWLKAKY
jgi:PAS domain S-box-containing protein